MSPQVYKVCHRRDNRLWSYIDVHEDIQDDVVLEYKVDEWTRPKIPFSPLYCFGNKEDALNFISNEDPYGDEDLALYECEVENIWSGRAFCYCVATSMTIQVKDFWANPFGGSISPAGALMCGSIKLTKLVQNLGYGADQHV